MKSYICKFLLIALMLLPASLMAQTDSATIAPAAAETVAPVVEAVAEEESSPIIPLDTVWVLIAAMLVFFMQPGFALVEAGLTRTKNTANILMKNFMDFSAGSVLYWILGFSIMFGAGGFFGWNGWGISEVENPCGNLPKECYFIFQTVFCATAATIVSGAMAERTKFSMYLVYSVLISAFVYPIQGHWSWGGGWLSEMGFHDFAGSAVVHSCGGFLAWLVQSFWVHVWANIRRRRTASLSQTLSLVTTWPWLRWVFGSCGSVGSVSTLVLR